MFLKMHLHIQNVVIYIIYIYIYIAYKLKKIYTSAGKNGANKEKHVTLKKLTIAIDAKRIFFCLEIFENEKSLFSFSFLLVMSESSEVFTGCFMSGSRSVCSTSISKDEKKNI